MGDYEAHDFTGVTDAGSVIGRRLATVPIPLDVNAGPVGQHWMYSTCGPPASGRSGDEWL